MAYIQDLTTYTETDPNSRITVTARHIDAYLSRDEDAYVYKDFTADYFNDFEHRLEATPISTTSNDAGTAVWALTNTVDDLKGIVDASGTAIWVWFERGSGGVRSIKLRETHSGSTYTDSWSSFAYATPYYLTIEKTGTALTCKIYSDSTRDTRLDTLSLTLQADHTFRYLFACCSYDDDETNRMDIDIDDLEEKVYLSTDGFPYNFPIVWATLVEIAEIGVGYDAISESVTLTVAETGTGTDAIVVEDLTNTVYQMETKIIPKDLLSTKIIPKDLLATKVIPKDLLDTSIKGG